MLRCSDMNTWSFITVGLATLAIAARLVLAHVLFWLLVDPMNREFAFRSQASPATARGRPAEMGVRRRGETTG
ncbi:MAG TPA: hypothetical protein VLK35_07140 [Methylomirabilota bacterium]|nr:hypothetical protein [Methylomirabilota bacterium]